MNTSSSDKPKWLEILINVDPVAQEAVCAYLFNHGCEGIAAEDIEGSSLKAYFALSKDMACLKENLRLFLQDLQEIFPEIPKPEFYVSAVAEQDWSAYWRRFFRPERVTQNLLTLPPWESPPHSHKGHVIRIDPGPAFGTGQHPTTRMCLLAIEKALPVAPWSMVDVGTGSGILAIYAAILGAHRVLGIDLDLEAIRWAERNLILNSVSESVELSTSPLQEWDEKFNVIAANLTLGTILGLLPCFSRSLNSNGLLILSGLLIEQVEEIETHLPSQDLKRSETLYMEEWACLIAEHKDG